MNFSYSSIIFQIASATAHLSPSSVVCIDYVTPKGGYRPYIFLSQDSTRSSTARWLPLVALREKLKKNIFSTTRQMFILAETKWLTKTNSSFSKYIFFSPRYPFIRRKIIVFPCKKWLSQAAEQPFDSYIRRPLPFVSKVVRCFSANLQSRVIRMLAPTPACASSQREAAFLQSRRRYGGVRSMVRPQSTGGWVSLKLCVCHNEFSGLIEGDKLGYSALKRPAKSWCSRRPEAAVLGLVSAPQTPPLRTRLKACRGDQSQVGGWFSNLQRR